MRIVVLLALMGMCMGLELPSVIADHMVLQRQSPVTIWGWATASSTVQLRFRDATVSAVAAADGRWEAQLASGAAGGPFQLQVEADGETRTLSDILVGEVWVAGGQSNMWWRIDHCFDAEQVKAQATAAEIRFFDANTHPREGGWAADEAQRTVAAEWSVCSPTSVGSWSGVAYFFAKRLHEELGVPVGIVHVAVPGQAVERFMRPELLRKHFPNVLMAFEHDQATQAERQAAHEQALAAWKAGGEQGKKPKAPKGLPSPATLWNGTVAPCVPFTSRGFIWWQGEANAARSQPYLTLFAAMLQDWREQWRRPDAPFYVVELANFGTRPDSPVQDAPWPALRDAQQRACLLSDAYAVNTLDVMDINEPGAPWQIHPRRKYIVGERLATRALSEVHGREQAVWRCPRITAMSIAAGAITLSIDQIGDGLKTIDGQPPRCFAICGSDRQWQAAEARIAGETIVLSSPLVSEPIAVRYAWANNPDVNLVNSVGLPLGQWRSDCWLLWPH